ncbi:MAG: 30S ribosomal protein S8 [Candidatus Harrisonbacteria bacterium CG10_big_fil_rev_8_21_14_0_10_44_23]|uniref:Small ribosomal subunit protein uS8 n=1 Tax=Candidatus Harrisonbacteria bacterium CG10_big_fil_rev_8_21_14_0_10_44_23 TaxID=1974585 RepID=A0A2H0UQH6_9BACT|nr:MAG: 30S ribosomal protein S8 [Candidatus Harrisonbacteria bacterium CG10_big_fil_rev_8_21_14_0_10_44_23]
MYTNILAQIKNAQAAKKDSIKVPYSGMDLSVLELLAKKGFIASVEKKGRMPKRILEIKPKYDEKGKGAISGTRLLSKPSRRLYSGYQDLYPIRQGFGLCAISTSKGIMGSIEAKRAKLGGQLLFEIW